MRHLLKLLDLSPEEIIEILNLADQLKYEHNHGIPHPLLAGKTLGMIMGHPSTRTRVSFEVGMVQLGGYPLVLKSSDLQLGHGEPLQDTARSLSGYLNAVMIRTASQQEVEDFSKFGSIPVINALTDFSNPCEVLADLMTIRERKGNCTGLKMAFLGNGRNNTAHSTVVGCLKMGMTVAVGTPKGYEPSTEIHTFAKTCGDRFLLTHDPVEAARDADIISTDVWGTAEGGVESDARKAEFGAYQVNRALLCHARSDVMVQHCLPARQGEEISVDLFEQYADDIFDASENRLHTQKAILVKLLQNHD